MKSKIRAIALLLCLPVCQSVSMPSRESRQKSGIKEIVIPDPIKKECHDILAYKKKLNEEKKGTTSGAVAALLGNRFAKFYNSMSDENKELLCSFYIQIDPAWTVRACAHKCFMENDDKFSQTLNNTLPEWTKLICSKSKHLSD